MYKGRPPPLLLFIPIHHIPLRQCGAEGLGGIGVRPWGGGIRAHKVSGIVGRPGSGKTRAPRGAGGNGGLGQCPQSGFGVSP
ncbi:hypothetical protein HGRIS_002766 [Hohenbuehelia grisea]